MTTEKQYQIEMKKFISLENKVEALDRKNNPYADTLRMDLDVIQAKLSELSAKMEEAQ